MKRTLLFIALLFCAIVSKSQVIEDGVYVIKSSVNPHYVIDLRSSNAANGENIHCWEENGTNAQRWILERVGNVKIMKL